MDLFLKKRDHYFCTDLFLIEAKEDYSKPSTNKWLSEDIKRKALLNTRYENIKYFESCMNLTLDYPSGVVQPTGFYEYWVF